METRRSRSALCFSAFHFKRYLWRCFALNFPISEVSLVAGAETGAANRARSRTGRELIVDELWTSSRAFSIGSSSDCVNEGSPVKPRDEERVYRTAVCLLLRLRSPLLIFFYFGDDTVSLVLFFSCYSSISINFSATLS